MAMGWRGNAMTHSCLTGTVTGRFLLAICLLIVSSSLGHGLPPAAVHAQPVHASTQAPYAAQAPLPATAWYFAPVHANQDDVRAGVHSAQSISVVNANGIDVPVTFKYRGLKGTLTVKHRTIPAGSTAIEDATADAGPDAALEIIAPYVIAAQRVERRLAADGSVLAIDSTPGVPEPSMHWRFAEGYAGLTYHEYLSLYNPGALTARITVHFASQLRGGKQSSAGGSVAPVSVTLAPGSWTDLNVTSAYRRASVKSLGLLVDSTQPIVAGRTLYWGPAQASGHAGVDDKPGLSVPSTNWFFTGASLSGEDQVFVTLVAPNGAKAQVAAIDDSGRVVQRLQVQVAAGHRATVLLHSLLHLQGSVQVRITADQPLVAEIAQYHGGSPNVAAYPGDVIRGVALPSRFAYLPYVASSDKDTATLYLYNPSAQAEMISVRGYAADGMQASTRVSIPAGHTVRYPLSNLGMSAPVYGLTLATVSGGFVAAVHITAAVAGGKFGTVLRAPAPGITEFLSESAIEMPDGALEAVGRTGGQPLGGGTPPPATTSVPPVNTSVPPANTSVPPATMVNTVPADTPTSMPVAAATTTPSSTATSGSSGISFGGGGGGGRQPTPLPSATPSHTVTATHTATVTDTATATPTVTATVTDTPSVTPTATDTPVFQTLAGLQVSVGYADSLRASPDLPVPWKGDPNVIFFGGGASLDAGAIRIDNPTDKPVNVKDVTVNLHSNADGTVRSGQQFDLWPDPNNTDHSFTIPPHGIVIMTQNFSYNFDTSDFGENGCGQIAPPTQNPPKIVITLADGQNSVLVDTQHVLDTGDYDFACQGNESLQWRPIGTVGLGTVGGHLTLGPPTASVAVGQQDTVVANLTDASGILPLVGVTVHFTVLSGPNAGLTGQDVTNAQGLASFSYTSTTAGTDTVQASVTNTSGGSFNSNTVTVNWSGGATDTATATGTSTPLPATSTTTNTPVPATSTGTSSPTSTFVASTSTATSTSTQTPISATSTRTNTPVPATDTASATATNTAVPATSTVTSTATHTPVPATSTRTSTPTATNTSVSATATATSTSTRTPIPATSTASATVTHTATTTNTPTSTTVPATSTATATITSTATTTNKQDITPPQVTLQISPVATVSGIQQSIVQTGQPAGITVTANDNVGISSLTLTVNGVVVPLDIHGHASYIPVTAGLYTAIATAKDAAGNSAQATGYFSAVSSTTAPAPPVAILASPDTDTTVSASTALVGTATATQLTYYDLQYSPAGVGDYTNFFRGFSAVSNGTLATLDPTAFQPGIYDFRVCVDDAWGQYTCSAIKRYTIGATASKPGSAHFSFLDGQASVLDLPIVIRRVYDSRNRTSGDFGYGWSLDSDQVKLQEDRPMGSDWEEQQSPDLLPVYSLIPDGQHRASIFLPDGTIERFAVVPDPQQQQIEPIQFLNGATFQALPGTNATLSPGSVPDIVNGSIPGPVTLIDSSDTSGNSWNPPSYTMKLPDGRQFTFNQTGAQDSLNYVLAQVKDAAGNSLTYGTGGIAASSGASVAIVRDSQGRITSITNTAGKTRTYAYDTAGNLVSSTDYDGHTTHYLYDNDHNLIQIINPNGEAPGTIYYDDQGRITSVVDATGHRITISTDPSAHQNVVTDRLGHTTIYNYDSQGNTTSVTDPLGHTSTFSYDAQGNLLSRSDPLGNTETITRDPQGRPLVYTDARHNTTTDTYDANGNLTSVTDALGNKTQMTYDAQGNLTTVTSPRGGVTTFTRDSVGNVTQQTDATGGVSHYTSNSNGQLTGFTDPNGHSSQITMRDDGQVATDAFQFKGKTVKYDYQYDDNGSLIGQTLPDGNTSSMSYDASGLPTTTTNTAGNSQHVQYDANGNANSFTDYNGATLSVQRDAESQVTKVTMPDGEQVSRTLDAAGRPTGVTLPGGVQAQASYDAAGRITSQSVSGQGGATYTYDPNGNALTSTTSDGAVTHYTYDAGNELTAIADPLGNTTHLAYDKDGNLASTTTPDNATITQQYDLSDRLTKVTDERGASTSFTYDPAGLLSSVTDPAGGTTQYSHDELGDLSQATTPGGNTWSFNYNANGSMLSRTFPWGTSESYTRDPLGNINGITDGSGATTTFGYNQIGLLSSTTLASGASVQRTYTPGGKLATVTDASGTTTYGYDANGRVIEVDYPGGSFLKYTYDAQGRMATVAVPGGTTTYGYDSQGRMTDVTDTQLGATHYSYDLAGRVTQAVLPDGSTTTYTRNARGWVTHLHTVAKDGSTVLRDQSFSYDLAGNLLSDAETNRTQSFTYDTASRVVSETRVGVDSGSSAYAYNADWNPTQMGSRTLTYDGHMRLVSDGTWSGYTYDGAGQPLTRSAAGMTEHFSYDSIGRLIRLQRTGTVPAGMALDVVLQYNYDNLISRIVTDGVARNLVWETTGDIPQLMEERTDGGTVIRRYVQGLGSVGMVDASGGRVFHQDMQGSIRLVTAQSTGSVVSSYAYSAYGETTQGASDATSPLQYDGEYYVPEIGLYFLRARFYDPHDGRFLTPDLMETNPQMPQSFSPYQYASDNPIRFSDPLGTQDLGEISVGLAIASTIASIALPYFPGPIVLIAQALGFKAPPGLDPVGLSFDLTATKGLLTGGFQFDINKGPHKFQFIFWVFFGGTIGSVGASNNPRVGTPTFTFWAGISLGSAGADPDPPHAGVYAAVSGTFAQVLANFAFKGNAANSRISPSWARGAATIQWELTGVTPDTVRSPLFVQSFTIYGSIFENYVAAQIKIKKAAVQPRRAWTAGVSLTLYLPLFTLTHNRSTSIFDASGYNLDALGGNIF